MVECCKNGQVVGHKKKSGYSAYYKIWIYFRRLSELWHTIAIQAINQNTCSLQEIQTTLLETVIDIRQAPRQL